MSVKERGTWTPLLHQAPTNHPGLTPWMWSWLFTLSRFETEHNALRRGE